MVAYSKECMTCRLRNIAMRDYQEQEAQRATYRAPEYKVPPY